MRTLIDIPEDQVERLSEMAAIEKVSRAALVRRAIAELIGTRRAAQSVEAFGLWSGAEDGLAYQRRVRKEW